MTLHEKQVAFARLVFRLVEHIFREGYEATLGEAYRPPETAALYAKQKKGIKNSLHTQRLALDINLFKDGQYLKDSNLYLKFGVYWESLSTPGLECCWGGRFKDGNHFSISHNGIK